MAKSSRVPSAVGAIPVVGDLVKQAEGQAQWLQDLVEQNARLVGQLPATMKAFNDSLERFNQTVGRLDKAVSRIEGATSQLIAPLEQMTPQLDRLRDIPELLDTLRREAVPALRAATDTQKQIALLSTTVERILAMLNELPGASIVRRITGTGTASRAETGTGRPENGVGTEDVPPTH
jgi:ABC-type transporter Mla subunit MlaD